MTYDGAGNRLALPVSMPTVNSVAGYGGATYYTYDGTSNTNGTTNPNIGRRGQLTQEATARGGNAVLNFDYDPSGNPTTFRSTGGIGYNANNQNSSTAYTYDGNGNPTTYPLTSGSNGCSYDLENRLVRLDNTNTTTTYGYRADGLRAWKQVLNKAGGVGENGAHKGGAGTNGLTVVLDGLTYFLYDGGSVVAELDSNGDLTAVHTWGMGGLLSRQTVSGNTSSVYVFDPSGNVARRLDGNGTVKGSHVFDAWGAKRAGNDASPDCYCGYGGQWGYYTDSESGLTLCGHRYYDSATGRWLTRDPIGYEGGINLYGYVGNNAANKIDPSGYSIASWLRQTFDNVGFLGGWLLGMGPDHNTYSPCDAHSQQLKNSLAGDSIREDLNMSRTQGSIGTGEAFLNSMIDFNNGTEWQVGGFTWDAVPTKCGWKVHVHNVASAESFFYHYLYLGEPKLPVVGWWNPISPITTPLERYMGKWDRWDFGIGPMGNVYQDFYWYEGGNGNCCE